MTGKWRDELAGDEVIEGAEAAFRGVRAAVLSLLLARGDDSFARNGGKPLQKVLQGLSALQVVEQRLEGRARSAKHGRPAENVRVSSDDTHEDILTRCNGRVARRS